MPSSLIVPAGGLKTGIVLAASDKIAVYSRGTALVYAESTFAQFPSKEALLQEVSNREYVSAAVSAASLYTIDNTGNPYECLYEVGTTPVVKGIRCDRLQDVPNALDIAGPITPTMILNGILTSAAAAVTGTLPNPSLLEAAGEWVVGDAIGWSVIKVGANTFTVAQSADGFHTIVGNVSVLTATSAFFRTRKVTATTFVTYRIG
jgi:hypothetical protein